MHAFLRLITNPDSDVDILRVINVPSRGIGNTTTKRLGEIAGSRRTGLWDAIPVAVASDDLGRKERMQLHAFRDMIENFVKTSTAERPSDVAKRLVTGTGYKRMYELEAKEQETAGKYAEAKVSAERAANVDEVINAVASYESRASAEGDIPTLRGYVQAVSLAMQQDRDEDVTKVTLQTVHAAKGLEWPFVWMVGVEEGKFPGRSTDALQQEEERRLAYVCITRARERLWVTHAYQRYVRGQMESAGPSRYIGEMEEHAGDSVDRVDFDELEKREQEMRLRAQETRI